jgi:hypothetical protein
MRQIFVFTAGEPEARRHIEDSIRNSVSTNLFDETLSVEEARYFKSLLPAPESFFAWGAVPGQRNKPTWDAMQVGDVVLTVYANHYQFVSSVVGKLNSKALATRIWGTDDLGQTWEYMYLLTKPQPVSVHVLSSPVVDYLNKGYRGYTKISNERIQTILRFYPNLEAFLSTVFGTTPPPTMIERELEKAESEADAVDEFDPENLVDGRKKVIAEIVRRRGQPKFRRALLEAYAGKCAVTGCEVETVLEAAHIVAYAGDQTNKVSNGLLLRADIHTLFDLGHLKIDVNAVIHLHEGLTDTTYSQYRGKKAQFPIDAAKAPHPNALAMKFGQVL